MRLTLIIPAIFVLLLMSCQTQQQKSILPANLFEYSENLEPRWVSFENQTGAKGSGGMENNGAKGHAFDMIPAGEAKTLLNIEGPGIINRIWITIRNRSAYDLRGLVIKMYWDGEEKPAVSVPFGDFFGVGLGKTAAFENVLFANPEGRSFNSFIQMPFKKSAKIEIVNDLDYDLSLIFYDVDLQLLNEWSEDFLYFHSYWHRDTATTLAEDFEILPKIQGKGRFLGTNVSVTANPDYKNYWWGEGEIKVYLNGDTNFPTLVGTGTEDYIGTAWGQGEYNGKYTGCLVADSENLQWTYYRYHVVDPIYFKTDCKVTVQQMGGTQKRNVIELQKNNVKLLPVAVIGDTPEPRNIYKKDSIVDLEDPNYPNMDSWVNFYRSDDYAAVAYFYLDKPSNSFPEIQELSIRTWNLKN